MRSFFIGVFAIFVAAILWSGWWWYGSTVEERTIAAWIGRTDGASARVVSTSGYPNRFDTTLTGPELKGDRMDWSAEFMQILRLSYRPGRYILVFDTTQRIDTGVQVMTLTAEQARASVARDRGTLRSSFVIDAPSLASSAGWTATANTMLFATRPDSGGTEVGLDLRTLEFDGVTSDVHLQGVVTEGADGQPSGELLLKVGHWPSFLALLRALEAVTPDQFDLLSQPTEERVQMTVILTNGRVSLGGVDIGPLPIMPLPLPY
ncbi:DUF2125 domain-containing protein [Psychromarinibacter sp. S121]|uniref:DUF2125 domain-containing protein n=1 Tax=Psychromarinibacter sp. S121 TaxID=3415127 RepID=UPI003C7A19CB